MLTLNFFFFLDIQFRKGSKEKENKREQRTLQSAPRTVQARESKVRTV